MNNLTNMIALVVISCDNYSDLWEGFDKSISKFWTECPFDIFLITNYQSYHSKKITSLQVGEDKSWSQGLKNALNVIKDKYKYSIITLEDLYIIDNVDNDLLLQTLDKALSEEVKYLRLHRNKYNKSKTKDLYEPLKSNVLYRFNCTYSLWDNNFLHSLLKDEENAWQFEYNSPKRVEDENKIYMVKEPIFKYSNTVIKGKWVPTEVELINRLFPDYNINREVMTTDEFNKILRDEKRYKIALNYLPNSLTRYLIIAKRKFINKK